MSSGAAKILVADDSSSERTSAREALEGAGYEVVEAVDGQQALEVYTRERPDLVMLDVVMPRLTGPRDLPHHQGQGAREPTCRSSCSAARNSVNARVEGLRSGADDYLGKPYDAEELKARVEAVAAHANRCFCNDDSRPGETRTSLLLLERGRWSRSGETRWSMTLRRATLLKPHALDEEFDRARALRVTPSRACGCRVDRYDPDCIAKSASPELVSESVDRPASPDVIEN